MLEKSFPCRPVSRQASFEIAAKFADDLEHRRAKILFLPERKRLIALLTIAIESGQLKLTAVVKNDTPDRASISTPLTSGFLVAAGDKSSESNQESICVNSSWIESLATSTAGEPSASSITH